MNEKKPLRELASVIRSKNAGPFELTLDIIFKDQTAFDYAVQSNTLNSDTICELYGLSPDKVLATQFFPPALAFKATVARAISSGSVGDSDVFGAQQHAPLLELLL